MRNKINVNFDNLRIAHKLASVMEVNNYYPGVYPERSPIAIGRRRFLNSSLSYSRSGNRYKYQTKEIDNYFDYNVLDFGARHYDPAVARWTAYDPASQYATPYIAMGGNPVSGIDPTGTVSNSYQGSANLSNNYTLASNNNNSMDTWFEGYYSSSGGGGVDINWDHHDYGTSASGNQVNFAGQIAGIIANAGANGGSTLWGPTHLWLLDNSGLNFNDWANKHFGNNLNFLPPMSNPNWTTLGATAANLPEAKVVANRYLSGDEISRFFSNYGNIITNSVNWNGVNTGLQVTDFIGVGAAAGREIAIDYRISQPLMNRVGKSANMKTISRLGTASKNLGVAGYAAAGIVTVLDINAYNKGQLSGAQLSYNITGTSVGLGVGYFFGPIAGAVAGSSFWGAQQIYDGYTYWQTQMSIYLTNFENGLKNGWVPGR